SSKTLSAIWKSFPGSTVEQAEPVNNEQTRHAPKRGNAAARERSQLTQPKRLSLTCPHDSPALLDLPSDFSAAKPASGLMNPELLEALRSAPRGLPRAPAGRSSPHGA